jgi:ribosomal protein L11 methyltransferase
MPDNSWLEVSILVDGELAEAVAEVFSRYAPGGVAIESTAVTANDDDEGGQSVGPLRVCAYLPMLEGVEETRRRLEEAVWYLGRIRPLPIPQFRLIHETDWAEAWKTHYHPIEVGQRLIIVPAWLEIPAGDRLAIRMDPGMAFGTGTHPTTQLCLEMIEDWFLAHEAASTIDVGCGSGILSVAAVKLGASHTLGVDIDPQAIPVARENAALNGVAERLELGVGSVKEILAGNFSLRQGDLVLANILAPIIIRLLDDGLASLVASGGALVLSGVLEDQWEGVNGHPSLRAAIERQGLRKQALRQSGDWISILVSGRD